MTSESTQAIHDKVAYATFYSTRLANDAEQDPYFDAVQLLAYQILHRPSTRTSLNIPLLVFVPPHVSEARRRILRFLGARVIELAYVRHQIRPRRERWIDQLCKLRIFEQVDYDRILYLDVDMLLTRSLDAIWSEEVCMQKCQTRIDESLEDDTMANALLPDSYLFVGVPDTYGSRKPDPPIPFLPLSINAGFWLASPSRKLFEYYTSLLSDPAGYDSQYMEQGVFRHAHRDQGPMPWQQFEPGKWNVNWPRVEDLWRGTATLHDRFWMIDEPWMEPELVQRWDEAMSELVVFRCASAVRNLGPILVSEAQKYERWQNGCLRLEWERRNGVGGARLQCA